MTRIKHIDHPEPVPSCLTVTQLSERWGCTRKTIWLRIQRGEIGAFRVGKNYRIKIEEVERFESEHAAKGAA